MSLLKCEKCWEPETVMVVKRDETVTDFAFDVVLETATSYDLVCRNCDHVFRTMTSFGLAHLMIEQLRIS